jgi:hypothetical protein
MAKQEIPTEVLDLLRFMCQTWAKIDGWATEELYHIPECGDALMRYPVIQGSRVQRDLKAIGQQTYDVDRLYTAMQWMLVQDNDAMNDDIFSATDVSATHEAQDLHNPEFEKANDDHIHDWRNYVGENTIRLWQTFTDQQRVAFFWDADKLADEAIEQYAEVFSRLMEIVAKGLATKRNAAVWMIDDYMFFLTDAGRACL